MAVVSMSVDGNAPVREKEPGGARANRSPRASLSLSDRRVGDTAVIMGGTHTTASTRPGPGDTAPVITFPPWTSVRPSIDHTSQHVMTLTAFSGSNTTTTAPAATPPATGLGRPSDSRPGVSSLADVEPGPSTTKTTAAWSTNLLWTRDRFLWVGTLSGQIMVWDVLVPALDWNPSLFPQVDDDVEPDDAPLHACIHQEHDREKPQQLPDDAADDALDPSSGMHTPTFESTPPRVKRPELASPSPLLFSPSSNPRPPDQILWIPSDCCGPADPHHHHHHRHTVGSTPQQTPWSAMGTLGAPWIQLVDDPLMAASRLAESTTANPEEHLTTNTKTTTTTMDSRILAVSSWGDLCWIRLVVVAELLSSPLSTQENDDTSPAKEAAGLDAPSNSNTTTRILSSSYISYQLSVEAQFNIGRVGVVCAALMPSSSPPSSTLEKDSSDGGVVVVIGLAHGAGMEAWYSSYDRSFTDPNAGVVHKFHRLWRGSYDDTIRASIRSILHVRTQVSSVNREEEEEKNDDKPSQGDTKEPGTPLTEAKMVSRERDYLFLTLQPEIPGTTAGLLEAVDATALHCVWQTKNQASPSSDHDNDGSNSTTLRSVRIEDAWILPEPGQEIVDTSTLPPKQAASLGMPRRKIHHIPSHGSDVLCSLSPQLRGVVKVDQPMIVGAALSDGTVALLTVRCQEDGSLAWGVEQSTSQLLLSYPPIGIGHVDYSRAEASTTSGAVPHAACCLRGGLVYLIPASENTAGGCSDESIAKPPTSKDLSVITLPYPHDLDSDATFQHLHAFTAGNLALVGGGQPVDTSPGSRRIPVLAYAWPGGIIDLFAAKLLPVNHRIKVSTELLMQALIDNGTVETLSSFLSQCHDAEIEQLGADWQAAQKELASSPRSAQGPSKMSGQDLAGSKFRATCSLLLRISRRSLVEASTLSQEQAATNDDEGSSAGELHNQPRGPRPALN